MTLETLITFLTIENNNMNNYLVTLEYRVMVTAFAILAMFFLKLQPARRSAGSASLAPNLKSGKNPDSMSGRNSD